MLLIHVRVRRWLGGFTFWVFFHLSHLHQHQHQHPAVAPAPVVEDECWNKPYFS